MNFLNGLFAVDTLGRVCFLSVNSTKFVELQYVGIEFKQISCSSFSLWAIGVDLQLYVYVYLKDKPIRVKECCFENQRWNPVDGYSKNLLPTDRFQFSDISGNIKREREDIHVPSSAWQWESPWFIQDKSDGDGWQYAVDFPAEYSTKKSFTSCVRRRKWIRFRRFTATNTWSALPGIQSDISADPFISVSIGGAVEGNAGEIFVWVVTVSGQVYVRQGVTSVCPEGCGWLHITTPNTYETIQICANSLGSIWTISRQGNCLYRLGVSKLSPTGTHWCDVESPSEEVLFSQISLGDDNILWALADCEERRQSLWYRIDNKWSFLLCMEPGITHLTSAGYQAVLAVCQNDGSLLYGSLSNIGANMWKRMAITKENGNAHFNDNSRDGPSTCSDHQTVRVTQGICNDGFRKRALFSDDTKKESSSLSKLSLSEAVDVEANCRWIWLDICGSCTLGEDSSFGPLWFKDENSQQQKCLGEEWRMDVLQNSAVAKFSNQTSQKVDEKIKCSDFWVLKTPALIQRQHEKGSSDWIACDSHMDIICRTEADLVATILFLPNDPHETKLRLTMSKITCVCLEGKKTLKLFHTDLTMLVKFKLQIEFESWYGYIVAGVNIARGVTTAPSADSSFVLTENGEVLLLDEGKVVAAKKNKELYTYMYPIHSQLDVSSKKLYFDFENGWNVGCRLSFSLLIQEKASRFAINFNVERRKTDEDIAFHFNPRMNENEERTVVVLNTREATHWGIEELRPLIIMTQDSTVGVKAFAPGRHIQIEFVCEPQQFVVFVNDCLYTSFKHRINYDQITNFSLEGDINVIDIKYSSLFPIIPLREKYWRLLGGGAHFIRLSTCCAGVVWAIGSDYSPWVYTGGWGGSYFSRAGYHGKNENNQMKDTRVYHTYENQRWNPFGGFTSHLLPTDRPAWSNRDGSQALDKDSFKLPSFQWKWTSDWSIENFDENTNGWEYASDFPSTFTSCAKPSFTDCVRRRRWIRKCSLNSSGPWMSPSKSNIQIKDISIYADAPTGCVDVWAISAQDGGALYRSGVTSSNPGGSDWLEVFCDVPFVSVSVSGNSVWTVGENGCAFVRHAVSKKRPTGELWLQVFTATSGPLSLVRICVGCNGNQVLALDHAGCLYSRLDVSPHSLPEGSTWCLIEDNTMSLVVRDVSINDGQIWAVLEQSDGNTLLGRRLGITDKTPYGCDWEVALDVNVHCVYIGKNQKKVIC